MGGVAPQDPLHRCRAEWLHDAAEVQFYSCAHSPDEKIASFTKKKSDDRMLDNFKELFRKQFNI